MFYGFSLYRTSQNYVAWQWLCMHIVTCMNDSQWGFGLDIGFIDHLCVVTTSTYNSLMGLHTSNISVTTPHIKSSVHSLIFNWALNSLLQTAPVITSQHGPHRKDCPSVAIQLLLIKNLLPSNGHYSVVCLATAACLALQFLLWANMPQY
jgi:hypothetical protein